MRTTALIAFLCLLSPVFSQNVKDTVVFINWGSSNLVSEHLDENIKSISGGMYYAFAVTENGNLQTFIDPGIRMLQVPFFDEPVEQIAVGDIHAVQLYESKKINQFFVHEKIEMFYPHKLQAVKEVKAGPIMSVALNTKHILYAWGKGDVVKKNNIYPKTYGVKTASVGKKHIAFINIKDRVFVWGDHSKGQNNIPKFKGKPLQIASGNDHVLVLDEYGKVYVWGDNSHGQTEIPEINQKVKAIVAKHNHSLVLLENNEVIIWGEHQTSKLDFSPVGDIKEVTLGYNFAALVIQKNEVHGDLSGLTYLLNHNPLNKAAIDSTETPVTAWNFLGHTLVNNYPEYVGKGNTITAESVNSYLDNINSNTDVVFEGEGNQLKIINKNRQVTRKNSHQRVIIKGSNRKATIVQQGDGPSVIENDNSVLVIDLDKIGVPTSYPDEYDDTHEYESNTSFDFVDIDSTLPRSMINEWPVYSGEYVVHDQVLGKISDYQTIYNNAGFILDDVEHAKAYFYCNKTAEAMAILEEGAENVYNDGCRLALFDIYYYGLFDIKPDQAKAKYYLNLYYESIKEFKTDWSNKIEDDNSSELLFRK